MAAGLASCVGAHEEESLADKFAPAAEIEQKQTNAIVGEIEPEQAKGAVAEPKALTETKNYVVLYPGKNMTVLGTWSEMCFTRVAGAVQAKKVAFEVDESNSRFAQHAYRFDPKDAAVIEEVLTTHELLVGFVMGDEKRVRNLKIVEFQSTREKEPKPIGE